MPAYPTAHSSGFSSHPLENFLQGGSGAGKLLAHAQLLVRLAKIYTGATPAYLGSTSRVVNFRGGIVVIHADNGATAAKLRQMAPRLTEAFVSEGIQCNGLRIETQAPTPGMLKGSTGPSVPAARMLSRKACAEITACMDSLPDSSLRNALQRLLDHARQE
ncbi:MAG: DUF721 domain-containing protein [Betaproteobacteria bacterium]|nr:DUF721 domain-containing protein [Betaproteobacteria bacterium]